MPKDEVLAYAKKNVGYTEGKNNNNIFSALAGHPNNQPWCATFIVACFKVGGEAKAIKNSASCIEIEQWANAHKRAIPLDESNSDYQAYLKWLENPNWQEETNNL